MQNETKYNGYRSRMKNILDFSTGLLLLCEKIQHTNYDLKRDPSNIKFYIFNKRDKNLEAEIFGDLIIVNEESQLNEFFETYSKCEINEMQITHEEKYVQDMITRGLFQNLSHHNFSVLNMCNGSGIILDPKKRIVGNFHKGSLKYDASCKKLNEIVSEFNEAYRT